MKNILILSSIFAFCLLAFASATADPGILIDAKGKVTIDGMPAKVGSRFNDGSTVEVPKKGAAQLMFSNGTLRKLNGGDIYVAAKGASNQAGKPLIDGIAMALSDAKAPAKGPVVHGMVKELSGPAKAAKLGDLPLPPARKKQMDVDISRVNLMGLSRDGKAVMLAQVYYKYGQYDQQVKTLLPVYRSQKPASDTVKELLALGYDKMGMADEAEKYRK